MPAKDLFEVIGVSTGQSWMSDNLVDVQYDLLLKDVGLLQGEIGSLPRFWALIPTASELSAVRRQVMPAVEHRLHKGLNNRAENSHLPKAPVPGSPKRPHSPHNSPLQPPLARIMQQSGRPGRAHARLHAMRTRRKIIIPKPQPSQPLPPSNEIEAGAGRG